MLGGGGGVARDFDFCDFSSRDGRSQWTTESRQKSPGAVWSIGTWQTPKSSESSVKAQGQSLKLVVNHLSEWPHPVARSRSDPLGCFERVQDQPHLFGHLFRMIMDGS